MIGGEFAANDAHHIQETKVVRVFAPFEDLKVGKEEWASIILSPPFRP